MYSYTFIVSTSTNEIKQGQFNIRGAANSEKAKKKILECFPESTLMSLIFQEVTCMGCKLNLLDQNDHTGVGGCLELLQKKVTCEGCRLELLSQEDHMGIGGCLELPQQQEVTCEDCLELPQQQEVTCEGCRLELLSQEDHMGIGGCLEGF